MKFFQNHRSPTMLLGLVALLLSLLLTAVGCPEDADSDGYASDQDCNDQDSSIHPDALEVPYDGIDQDCSGADLIDVDADGYSAREVGGQDCDDTNASVHPGALEDMGNGIDDDCDGVIDSGGSCACPWEGPVTFELSSAATTPSALYIRGSLTWQPCCALSSHTQRTWQVDPATGKALEGTIPSDAVPVILTDKGVEVTFEKSATRLLVPMVSSASISMTLLDIGDVYSVEKGSLIASILVESAQPK